MQLLHSSRSGCRTAADAATTRLLAECGGGLHSGMMGSADVCGSTLDRPDCPITDEPTKMYSAIGAVQGQSRCLGIQVGSRNFTDCRLQKKAKAVQSAVGNPENARFFPITDWGGLIALP